MFPGQNTTLYGELTPEQQMDVANAPQIDSEQSLVPCQAVPAATCPEPVSAPAWGNCASYPTPDCAAGSGVAGWVQEHPWLAILLVLGGIAALESLEGEKQTNAR